MTSICLLNEANINTAEFSKMVKGAQLFVNEVTKAKNLPTIEVITSPVAGSQLVHFTMSKRHTSAAAYHAVENGVPVAYVLPLGKPFGEYTPAVVRWLTKLVGKVRVNVSILTKRPASFRPGIITEACHELVEFIVNPFLDQYSVPDYQGHEWFLEPADHVFGTFFKMDVDGTSEIFPNFTLDAFYQSQATPPTFTKLDYCGIVNTPFSMTLKGYGYCKGPNGTLVKLHTK